MVGEAVDAGEFPVDGRGEGEGIQLLLHMGVVVFLVRPAARELDVRYVAPPTRCEGILNSSGLETTPPG